MSATLFSGNVPSAQHVFEQFANRKARGQHLDHLIGADANSFSIDNQLRHRPLQHLLLIEGRWLREIPTWIETELHVRHSRSPAQLQYAAFLTFNRVRTLQLLLAY